VRRPGKRKGDEIIGHNDEKSPEFGEWDQNPAGFAPMLVTVSSFAKGTCLEQREGGQIYPPKKFQPPAPMILTDSLFVRRDLRKELSSLLF
jgi:hypothetical protein